MNRHPFFVATMVAALSAVSATAEVERLQPDFSFKRVGVPSAGSSGRITVQIDPNAPPLDPVYADPEPTPAAIATPDLPEAPTPFSWFWNAVGTTIAEQSPGRLELAINAINSAPVDARVAAPRLQALQDLAAAHGREILKHTITNDVSPALVLAVISVESAGRVEAVSTAGAEGLMQLMPATAARFDVDDSMDPAQNIRGGVTYLGWLLDRFGNDPALALAGYNAGEGNVQRYEGVPPFAETRAYVPKVLAAWQVAKGLCTTPPELITDPCVFKVNGI